MSMTYTMSWTSSLTVDIVTKLCRRTVQTTSLVIVPLVYVKGKVITRGSSRFDSPLLSSRYSNVMKYSNCEEWQKDGIQVGASR